MSDQGVALKQQTDIVRQALEKMKGQFALALPKHLTPDRLLRVAMTAVQSTPKLLECDRTSLYRALMTCAQLGLEPDGVMGQAYLVPFKVRGQLHVQFIPGYKGLLTLARNSGEISSIQAHEVCEGDEFDYAYGLDERLHHRPGEGDRGEISHFYAYAKFKDGGSVFEVMTLRDVIKVRDASEGYKSALYAKKEAESDQSKAWKMRSYEASPWVRHFVQMGRKTAIRRLANYLPLQVQRAALIDEAADRGAHATMGELGEIIIDNETGEVIEEGGEQKKAENVVRDKLDKLAESDGGAPEANEAANGEGEAKVEKPAEKEKPARKAAAPKEAAKPKEPAPAAAEADGDGLFGAEG